MILRILYLWLKWLQIINASITQNLIHCFEIRVLAPKWVSLGQICRTRYQIPVGADAPVAPMLTRSLERQDLCKGAEMHMLS